MHYYLCNDWTSNDYVVWRRTKNGNIVLVYQDRCLRSAKSVRRDLQKAANV